MNDADIGYQPGDVVCCYPGTSSEAYGVVRYYSKGLNQYRVRILTKSPTEFVELGVKRYDMEKVQ